MNASDVLKNGHLALIGVIDDLPESDWNTAGVCGGWSAKDVIAHLGSYELLLADILTPFVDHDPTPCFDQFMEQGERFNDLQVEIRREQTFSETIAEYTRAHDRFASHAAQIPEATWRQTGTLPWYGADYSLDDLIVYTAYGHKREHGAQIAAFCDRLMRQPS